MRAIIGSAVALLVVCSLSVSSQERSVWDGVYTDDQAARGQTVFGNSCERCHAADVDFKGSSFLDNWENSTALDLFAQLQKTMPMDNPGGLQPQEYADVVAYFFRVNEFPVGKSELDTDRERLKLIRIVKKKQ
jgi:hypothetical protein